jgi:hypothetical protein
MNRIGNFLLFLGVFLIGLFLLSDIANTPNFSLLVYGGISFLAGIISKWTGPKADRPPNTRFRLIRSVRDRPKLTREEKKAAKEKRKSEKKKAKRPSENIK